MWLREFSSAAVGRELVPAVEPRVIASSAADARAWTPQFCALYRPWNVPAWAPPMPRRTAPQSEDLVSLLKPLRCDGQAVGCLGSVGWCDGHFSVEPWPASQCGLPTAPVLMVLVSPQERRLWVTACEGKRVGHG